MTLLLVILLIIIGILVAVIFGMKLKNKVGTVGYTGHTTAYYTNDAERNSASDDEDSLEESTEEEDYSDEDGDFEEIFEEDFQKKNLQEDVFILEKLGEDGDEDDFDDIDELDGGSSHNLSTDEESPIVMEISNVFGISGRSAVLCGKLEYPVAKGDELNICRQDGTVMYRAAVCKGIERNHKTVDTANSGDTVGLLFSVDASPIERGMMIRG